MLFVGCFLLIPGALLAAETPAIDSGATAWMLTSTALVLLMIPGLAMFYGGLVRTKNVLGTMDAQLCRHGYYRGTLGGCRLCHGFWEKYLRGLVWLESRFLLPARDR